MDIHEAPRLRRGAGVPLRPGMVITVEPGIYFPGNWGARIEDIVVVTEDGALAVNNRPHALIVVPVA